MRRRDAAMGLAVLVGVAGALVMRQADRGLIVRTVSLGGLDFPLMTAVDTQTGRAFVVSGPWYGAPGNGRMLVLDTATGTLLRRISVPLSPLALAMDESAGRVFVASASPKSLGQVLLLNARSGALLRTVRVGWLPDEIAVTERAGRAFVVNADPDNHLNGHDRVSVLDARSGRLLATVDVGWHPESASVDERAGRVFVASSTGSSISVLDARDGHVVRTIVVGLNPTIAMDEQTGRGFVVTSPGNSATMLDTASGRILRKVALGRRPSWNWVAVDERAARVLVVNLGRSTLRLLDARTGALLRTIPVARGSDPPLIDTRRGRAFIHSYDGRRVSVLDTSSGRLLRTIAVGPYSGIEEDKRGGRVFVATTNSVSTLDAMSGRLLRTVLFGPKPIRPVADQMIPSLSLALDERAGRAFAIDYYHNVVSELDAQTGAILRTNVVPAGPLEVLVDERSGHALLVSLGGSVSVADAWGWLPPWLRQKVPFLPPPVPHTRTTPASVSLLDVAR